MKQGEPDLDRPKAVTVIGVLILVICGLAVMGTLLSFLNINKAQENPDLNPQGYNLQHTFVLNIFGLILNIGMMIGAIGILKLKNKGRLTLITFSVATIIVSLGNLIYADLTSTPLTFILISFIVTAVLLGFVVCYLSKDTIKNHFVKK